MGFASPVFLQVILTLFAIWAHVRAILAYSRFDHDCKRLVILDPHLSEALATSPGRNYKSQI
uniref:Uncharacterized protein n=1 Tax=Arundo donax TaxID=35708 RepID=A0A0A9CVS9_ARUDO